MTCPDCLGDGKQVTCVYDLKQAGMVCIRCERVYSRELDPKANKHYASESACKRAMERAQRERRLSPSNEALVGRILSGR